MCRKSCWRQQRLVRGFQSADVFRVNQDRFLRKDHPTCCKERLGQGGGRHPTRRAWRPGAIPCTSCDKPVSPVSTSSVSIVSTGTGVCAAAMF